MKYLGILLMIIIIITTTISISQCISTHIKSNHVSNLIDCLVDIVEHLEGTIWKVSFITSNDDNDEFLENIAGKIRAPVLVNTVERLRTSGPDKRVKNDLVIVYGNVNASTVLKTVLWNGSTRFLIAYGMEKKCESKMGQDFREFWNERVIKVFGLVEESKGVSLYSFLPYQERDCDNTKPIRLDTWDNGTFLGDGFFFVNEKSRINNLMGCSVNVSVVDVKPMVFKNGNCKYEKEIDGIEVRYLKVIEKKLNFKAKYCTPKDGGRWGRVRPPKGVVGEVFTRISDFGFGLIAPIMERYENLELTRNYDGMECITFAVPVGAGYEPFLWLKDLNGDLRPIEWFLIFTSLASVTIIFSLCTTLSPMDSFMYIFSAFIGHAVKMPKRNVLKGLMLLWILFSSVIGDMYQASMGSRIIVRNKPPEIRTFSELVSSRLQLVGHTNMLDIIKNGRDNPLLAEMSKRFTVTDFEMTSAAERMLLKKDIAYIRHMSTFIYAILVNPKAKGNIRPLIECVYNYYPVIALQKNSPFAERVDKIILTIFESGLGIYWKSYFIYEISDITSRFQPFTIGQGMGIFVILLIGHSLAITAFFIEVVLGYMKKNTRRTRRKANHFCFLH